MNTPKVWEVQIRDRMHPERGWLPEYHTTSQIDALDAQRSYANERMEARTVVGRGRATKDWVDYMHFPQNRRNPGRPFTLRNMASVTIKRLPGGAVAVTGRHLKGGKR
jgi:hypothetical protein